MTVPDEWADDLEAIERALRQSTDASRNRPAELLVPGDEELDPLEMQWVIAQLVDKGWRVAVLSDGGIGFYEPGPLTDPGDLARQLN